MQFRTFIHFSYISIQIYNLNNRLMSLFLVFSFIKIKDSPSIMIITELYDLTIHRVRGQEVNIEITVCVKML